MCMWKFNDENIFFDKLTAFQLANSRLLAEYWLIVHTFVKSTPPRAFSVSFNTLHVCYRYTEDVHVKV